MSIRETSTIDNAMFHEFADTLCSVASVQSHVHIVFQLSMWFAPLAIYSMDGARALSYKDTSVMMFSSLKHPATGLDMSKSDAATEALFDEIWGRLKMYITIIERNTGAGGTYQPVARWLKRSALKIAFAGNVVDFDGKEVIDVDAAPEPVEATSPTETPSAATGRKGRKKAAPKKKKEKAKSAAALKKVGPESIVPGDRADLWIKGLEENARMEVMEKERRKTEKQAGRRKKPVTKSAAALAESAKDSKQYFQPKWGRNTTNLALFAPVLDILDTPLTSQYANATSAKNMLNACLKVATLTGDSTLIPHEHDPFLHLIIRTPLFWHDVLSHGFGDLIKYWVSCAIMETTVVQNYREGFIASDSGGYLRSSLEDALKPFLLPTTSSFPWPDGFRNKKKFVRMPETDTPLADLEIECTKYRQRAHEELDRLLTRVSSSIVTTLPLSFNILPSSASDSAVTTLEVKTAVRALHAVGDKSSRCLAITDLVIW